ncbi:transcriptional regulator [Longimycelium tulufanense]|uniref:Transcriptional regulator n=1 Tax=Longimycelium tulufanense TaxID=907463 RepID=A0A8J3FSG9_9PSEU|nr:helix-turn-helix transcriptional regulator [Longimycelium tulufanense]GGM38112.1 transcriptional regulator [Longimycelium tulufanense]
MPTTQTRRKLKVGRFVRELRERSGRSAEDAAGLLGCSRPTITRLENGQTLCARTELLELVRYYGATDDERAEALTLWENAKQDGRRTTATGRSPNQLRALLRAEAEASESRTIAPLVIDGLLQTADYARAINRAPSGFRGTEVDVERAVRARLRRQQVLQGPNPLRTHVLMDESAIRRVVGGPAVMFGQLQRLLTLIERTNITLQVVPFGIGAYGTMSGGFTLLRFPDPSELPVTYVEYPGGGVWVEDEAEVRKFASTFEEVRQFALTQAETADLIRAAVREHEGR